VEVWLEKVPPPKPTVLLCTLPGPLLLMVLVLPFSVMMVPELTAWGWCH
jgi:hypothetical protein